MNKNQSKEENMNETCQFYLRPHGVRPGANTETNGLDADLLSEKEIEKEEKKIKSYRRKAKSIFELTASHQKRNEDDVLSKHFYLFTPLVVKGVSTPFTQEQLIYLLADWYTLFCRKRQDYQRDLDFYRTLDKEMGETPEEHVKYALDKAVASVADDDLRRRYRQTFEEMQDDAKRNGKTLKELYRDLCKDDDDDEEPWPKMPLLNTNENRKFFTDILSTYLSRMDEVHIVKEELRHHYKAEYRPEELQNARDDMARVQRLRNLIKECESWQTSYALSEVRLDYANYGSKMNGQEERYAPFTDDQINEIIQATEKYYVQLKSGDAVKPNAKLTRSVIMSVADAYKEDGPWNLPDQFPFLYLMVCATGMKPFHTEVGVDLETFERKLNATYGGELYDARPARSLQRIARIELLDNLNRICGFDSEQQLTNWQRFLKLHGEKIQSEDEGKLWDDITNRLPGIAPVELQRMVAQCLEGCLPTIPEELYCYQGGSLIHTGGFFEYIGEHSEVVSELQKRIAGRGHWQEAEKDYFEMAFRYNYDPMAIRNRIKEETKKKIIKNEWKEIESASGAKMSEFCESLAIRQNREPTKERIENSVAELRSLLVEYAFREDAAAQIKPKLKKLCDKWLDTLLMPIGGRRQTR